MKAGIRLGPLALVLALALLALPAVASARPGWEEQPRSLHLSFSAMTDNGFLMALKTIGHRQVSLSLSKGNVLVSYRTTGRVSRKGVEATFGNLGEISVEFSGRPAPFRVLPPGLPPGIFPRPECRGRKPQHEAGTFHGTIRFDGEGDFTQIDADRAKGTMTRAYRRLCKGRAGGPFGLLLERAEAAAKNRSKLGDLSFGVLVAVGHEEGRTVVFDSLAVTGSSGEPLVDEILKAIFGPLALAGTVERRDGMRITRAAFGVGTEGSLIISPRKRKRVTATVAFPKPFEGTAEYEHAPGTPPTWLGTLAARLPGIGPVPLTGEGFETVFCRLALGGDAGEQKDNPCFKEAEELLPRAASASFLSL